MRALSFWWFRLQAVVWLLLGQNGKALAVFDDMVERFDDHTYARASRAHLHAQAGRHAAAMADYQALLARDPNDARTWFNQGFVLELQERWAEALTAFDRATAIDPKLDRAWYGKGLVLIRLQRLDDAIEALKRNTELQPMSPYGWYQLARIHVDKEQPDEAARIIRHLKGFEPKVAAQLERETGLLAGQHGQ